MTCRPTALTLCRWPSVSISISVSVYLRPSVYRSYLSTVLAVLDVQKRIKVLCWSFPHGSKLGNSQKVHGRMPKSSLLAKPLPEGFGQSD
jgi:hypothetical protein